MKNAIYITERDAKRLNQLIERTSPAEGRLQEYLARLKAELDRAEIVQEDHLPNGVITMNSVVEIEDLSDGEVETYTLVFPEEADASEGKISILAPIGTGMLGYRAGDEFEWETPGGKIRLKVLKVSARPRTASPGGVL